MGSQHSHSEGGEGEEGEREGRCTVSEAEENRSLLIQMAGMPNKARHERWAASSYA